MVEFSPATREARVQFPADASFEIIYVVLLNWKKVLVPGIEPQDSQEATCFPDSNEVIIIIIFATGNWTRASSLITSFPDYSEEINK